MMWYLRERRPMESSFHLDSIMEHPEFPMTPITPLPNPGEGGPVYPDPSGPSDVMPSTPTAPATPVIPAAPTFPAEPTFPAAPTFPAEPTFPAAPTVPAEPTFPAAPTTPAQPVWPGIDVVPVIWPKFANVRFLNAAYGYRAFRIHVSGAGRINFLGYASTSGYGRVAAGYQTVTVMGLDGYVYFQKTVPFQGSSSCTMAIINRSGGLDLLQIPDLCCDPSNRVSNFRVSNLASYSQPIDVLLADGRTIYADLRFKETAMYKRIRPGHYEFLFANTDQLPMPRYADIESLDSSFTGTYPIPDVLASLSLTVRPNTNYTVYLLTSSPEPNTIQTLVVEDH